MNLTDDALGSTIELQNALRKQTLDRRRRNGTSWFYLVAGLSVVNSVILMTGGKWSFIFGLGITRVVDAMSMSGTSGAPGTVSVAALVVDVLIAGCFALLGYFAFQGRTSAYVTGMVLYALDGVLFVVFADYLSAGFHLFVLWGMWQGLVAHRQLVQFATGGQAPSSISGAAA